MRKKKVLFLIFFVGGGGGGALKYKIVKTVFKAFSNNILSILKKIKI